MKAMFSKSVKMMEGRKNHSMGAASSGFKDNRLEHNDNLTIKLICYAFGTPDRQTIAALERGLRAKPEQSKNIHRMIAQCCESSEGLASILRPFQRTTRGQHNVAYNVAQKICEIAGHSQSYNLTILKKIREIGESLGLSQDEIQRLFEKFKLGV